jgi:uncharacterized protein YlzI (FlbEa/FlbD family)
MIPIWIELQSQDRGARMVNFANVTSFYGNPGRVTKADDVTVIHMLSGEHITVRDSYEYISDTLQKRTRQIRNLFSSMSTV